MTVDDLIDTIRKLHSDRAASEFLPENDYHRGATAALGVVLEELTKEPLSEYQRGFIETLGMVVELHKKL